MAVQCHFPTANCIGPRAFHDLVHAVSRLWTAHLIADASDADARDSVRVGRADHNAAVRGLIA